MKISLRQKLNDFIKQRGQVSYDEIKRLCETGYFGSYYRMATAERRMRPSESPDIEPIIEGGYIKAYKHLKPIEWEERAVRDYDGTIMKVIRVPKQTIKLI